MTPAALPKYLPTYLPVEPKYEPTVSPIDYIGPLDLGLLYYFFL